LQDSPLRGGVYAAKILKPIAGPTIHSRLWRNGKLQEANKKAEVD
jgi:hypothetical protein